MFKFEWHDIETPVLISLWMVFILAVKIVFHASERLIVVFPDSALLIFAGFFVGTIMDLFLPHDIYLDPDLFFLYLLPPIALEAGYFLPNQAFFRNIGTILTYAVIGTLWNIVSIGMVLYAFGSISGAFSHDIPLIDIMLFSTLISAVDPVAVLSVFTEINVNELLYICVFGESLLNDAVTIVLYHTLTEMGVIGSEHLETKDFIRASGSFVLVVLGGVMIGTLAAAITGLTTKFANTLNVVQPLICLLFPYLAYLLAEMAHYSGILAIVVCGLLMKPYVSNNLSDESRITVIYFLKTIASHSEAMIFIFLGLSTFSKNHIWDFVFTGITVAACLVNRFIGTYALSYLCNRHRLEKIGLVDQFIMAYGGLRGAICYGLVMTLDKNRVPAKDMFVSTTVVVICVTVFIQGTTIKPLVKFLRVKTKEPHKNKTVTDIFITNARDDMMAGIEAIAGIHGKYFWNRRLNEFNLNYVRPFLTTNKTISRGDEIVEEYEALGHPHYFTFNNYSVQHEIEDENQTVIGQENGHHNEAEHFL
ncbi:sodium/hydrogen exchanger family domain-containing protein [Ditylenchus destructor]|nr:sodium/hydrogen exchanger family domain-containing protein [Ditylenchus destructor]